MPEFDEPTCRAADQLIQLALDEDLQESGDLTSRAVIAPKQSATINIVAREHGVVAGTILIDPVCSAVCQRQGRDTSEFQSEVHITDGNTVEPGSVIASLSGSVRSLLTAERTVLNFLTHLSGVASLTAEFVRRTAGSDAVILDTRKTFPGYRLLQKYAVKCGGGTNHRFGLYDGILIKDNHLAARGESDPGEAVGAARSFLADSATDSLVEIEVDTIDQLRLALAAQPDIVLLDNMPPAQLVQAVQIRDSDAPLTLLEASGGVTLESVGCIAGTGVDRISIGQLTHSAPALDIGFDWSWDAPAQ